MEFRGNSEEISAPEYYFEENLTISPTPGDRSGVLSAIIAEAADGIIVANTLSKAITAIEDMVNERNDTDETKNTCLIQECWTQTILEPIPPSKFTELNDGEISKIIKFFPIEAMRLMRLVSFRWKTLLDNDFLSFDYVLTRFSIKNLQTWTNSKIERLTVCNLLDVEPDRLKTLYIWKAVKHLEIESQRLKYYDSLKAFEQPTVGEKNLVEILKLCSVLETLILNNGSVGNFGLELLEVNKDENCNEIVVGWQWPKVHESVTAVSDFLKKILGDLDENFGTSEIQSGYDDTEMCCEQHPAQIIPSDPPGVEITYKANPPPPFSAFMSLASVNLSHIQNLSITVQPTRNSEKIGLIAFLYVLTFPKLHSFVIHCEEYIPDEALYRCLFRFILKHKDTLKELTFTNPILSTNFAYAGVGAKQNYLAGLEKVRLREMTIAWELPIGLEMYWYNGHYLLESQRRLRKLEFHTTNTFKVETVVMNNFRFLTEANIDITDTGDKDFDCKCFEECARLKNLTLHVVITVKIRNVSNLPDTLEVLHWDAMYTQEDIRWFSRFLILAKCVYLYHDKDVPMDIFAPFNFMDFIHFIRLPCLEQLHLPRIHVQDPRVTRFCSKHCTGITQERDFFLIDRRKFIFQNAYAQYFDTFLTE